MRGLRREVGAEWAVSTSLFKKIPAELTPRTPQGQGEDRQGVPIWPGLDDYRVSGRGCIRPGLLGGSLHLSRGVSASEDSKPRRERLQLAGLRRSELFRMVGSQTPRGWKFEPSPTRSGRPVASHHGPPRSASFHAAEFSPEWHPDNVCQHWAMKSWRRADRGTA